MRTAVLDATLAELAASSYEELRIDDIAQRAGVNKTTVYRRWSTKAELVADAALANSQRAVPIPDTGSLEEDLRALVRSVAANIGTDPGARVIRNLVAAACGVDDAAAGMTAFWSERVALSRAIVDRAVERGELDHDADAGLIIETLIGGLYVRLLLTGRPITTDVADAIASIVHDGIARPAPAAAPDGRRHRPLRR